MDASQNWQAQTAANSMASPMEATYSPGGVAAQDPCSVAAQMQHLSVNDRHRTPMVAASKAARVAPIPEACEAPAQSQPALERSVAMKRGKYRDWHVCQVSNPDGSTYCAFVPQQ